MNLDFPALFFFIFYSSWRDVKLHLRDMSSGKSWVLLVPFLLLEVWFRSGLLLLHFYAEYIKTGDRTVGCVDLHTRTYCICWRIFVWPCKSNDQTSVCRSVKLIPFVIGGGVSYSSMVYWHASPHLPLTGISSFWWDLNVLTEVRLRAPRKEPDRTLDVHRVIYACLVTTRNSLKWEEKKRITEQKKNKGKVAGCLNTPSSLHNLL